MKRTCSIQCVLLLTVTLAWAGGEPRLPQLPAGAAPGSLSLRPCTFSTKAGTRYRGERGVLVVPENRGKADSRLITLTVVRFRSSQAKPAEPVFYLEGGPGQSNLMERVPKWIEPLLARHDLVMVGYRGIDGSVVLDSPEIVEALRGRGNDVLSRESRTNLGRAMERCRERFEALGVDWQGYSLPEVVEDMEAARAALNYPRLNLLSFSYGTRLALLYAQRYPERVLRSVQVGVNPPGHFVWEPRDCDEIIRRYAALWAADLGRRERVSDLAAVIHKVTRSMPAHWLCFPIDAGKVRVVTFFMFFQRDTAAKVIDAYLAAEHGDASGLALLSLAYDFILPRLFVWGEFFAKGFIDFDPERNYEKELDPPGSIMGAPGSLLIFAAAGGSRHWRPLPPAVESSQVRSSEVDTLLLSGNLDISTPAGIATAELLPHLSKGKQVILSDMAHCDDLMFAQPEAFQRLVTRYFGEGRVDESGFHHVPFDFRVRWGFPLLAKLALTAVIVIFLGLIALAIILRRWIRRKRRSRCALDKQFT